MEKIQEALKKAKQQRGQQGKQTHSSRKNPSYTTSTTAQTVPTDEINYTQTKVVPVSEQTLIENRLIAGIEGHENADVFRVLRTKVLQKMRLEKINSLAITSPTISSGKSFISANLAIAIAMEINQTVMLVDLDLRKPSLHQYFGIEADNGLADYLLDDAELNEMLIHPSIDRLVLLPAGRALPQSSELLSTPKMVNLVEDITNRYTSRIIIFDLPPLLGLDDALTLLPNVHASILVVEEGGDTKEEVQQSLRLLENNNLLGTVYNKAKQFKHLPY